MSTGWKYTAPMLSGPDWTSSPIGISSNPAESLDESDDELDAESEADAVDAAELEDAEDVPQAAVPSVMMSASAASDAMCFLFICFFLLVWGY
jgi:hypothetical protein